MVEVPLFSNAKAARIPERITPMTQCPKAVIFDFDGTLAADFQLPTLEMVERIARLLALTPVSIISCSAYISP